MSKQLINRPYLPMYHYNVLGADDYADKTKSLQF